MVPTIKINGKKYTAPAPKMKLYREITRFQTKFSSLAPDSEEALNEMEQLIVATFNNPEITAEVIDDQLDLADFIPLFNSIAAWIAELVNGKRAELPNE